MNARDESASALAEAAVAGAQSSPAGCPGGSLEAFADSRVGKTLCGKYLLDRVLGVGGMAAVYAATHRNRKQFAIKILHPVLSASEGIRQRFLREGYVANSVRHPGAVAVLDDDVAEDGSAFLVMELLDGENLEDIWASRGGSLPVRTALCLMAQVLDVLESAHRHGILHRDLKPPNLFLTRDGTMKVLDFGIARLQDTTGPRLTATGVSLGTPAFMAPEQVLGKSHEIDARSDLWAVGATLFVLLSGQLVHDGENSQQLMVYAATRPARSLAEVGREFPRALVELVDRALSFEMGSRFQSAADMRARLGAVHLELFGVPLSALPDDPSAAELCGGTTARGDAALSAPPGAAPEKTGARRAAGAAAAGRPAVESPRSAPAEAASHGLSSEIRRVPVASALEPPVRVSVSPAGAADTPAGAPAPGAVSHVEVNIAQVQSARLHWGVAATLGAVVLAVALVLFQHGLRSFSSFPTGAGNTAARAAGAGEPAAPPLVPSVPISPALQAGAERSESAAPRRTSAGSASNTAASTSRAPALLAPAKSRPLPSTLPVRCLRLLERQSLGEPLSAEERSDLVQRCRR